MPFCPYQRIPTCRTHLMELMLRYGDSAVVSFSAGWRPVHSNQSWGQHFGTCSKATKICILSLVPVFRCSIAKSHYVSRSRIRTVDSNKGYESILFLMPCLRHNCKNRNLDAATLYGSLPGVSLSWNLSIFGCCFVEMEQVWAGSPTEETNKIDGVDH